jgi:hypothetical protein
MFEERSEGNWFLIMASWGIDADEKAKERFYDVYDYLRLLAPPEKIPKVMQGIKRDSVPGEDDLLMDIVPGSLKSLNLIGRRKFVIVCKIKPSGGNRLLQTLSKKISFGAPISVEIFPATDVHDLIGIMPPETK